MEHLRGYPATTITFLPISFQWLQISISAINSEYCTFNEHLTNISYSQALHFQLYLLSSVEI